MSDGVEKVAQLVRYFVERGGHQLQINTINRETLLDAQAHPERHRHLIVRVWGWSGYFIELDKCYQDQIIRRVELGEMEPAGHPVGPGPETSCGARP